MRLRNIRLVEAPDDQLAPFHVVGPDQATIVGASIVHRMFGEDGIPPKRVSSERRAFLEFVDYLQGPGRLIDITASPAALMGAMKAYLRTFNLTTRKADKGPWTMVSGPDDKMGMRSDVTAVRRAYSMMSEAGFYNFPNPYELSEEAMRSLRLRAVHSGRNGRASHAALCSATLRFDIVSYKPPRRTQVELVRAALALLEEVWPPELVIYLKALHVSGCRPSDPTGWTVLDYYLSSRCTTSVDSTNKADGEKRTKTVHFDDVAIDIRRYVDEDRIKALPGALTLDEYIRLGDAGDHARLAEPLIVDAKGRKLDYDRIARRFRKDFADGCLDPVTGHPPIRRPTLHWFRHLFVYDYLALIEMGGGDEETKFQLKEQLVGIIGWKTGQAMLKTYGREFDLRQQAAAFTDMSKRRVILATAIASGAAHQAKPLPEGTRASGKISKMFVDRRAAPSGAVGNVSAGGYRPPSLNRARKPTMQRS